LLKTGNQEAANAAVMLAAATIKGLNATNAAKKRGLATRKLAAGFSGAVGPASQTYNNIKTMSSCYYWTFSWSYCLSLFIKHNIILEFAQALTSI
jgi:hypothetical protein